MIFVQILLPYLKTVYTIVYTSGWSRQRPPSCLSVIEHALLPVFLTFDESPLNLWAWDIQQTRQQANSLLCLLAAEASLSLGTSKIEMCVCVCRGVGERKSERGRRRKERRREIETGRLLQNRQNALLFLSMRRPTFQGLVRPLK